MKHSLRIGWSALLVVLFGVAIAQAQTGKIRGTVQDAETGEPLPGVNVIVQGTDLGAAANENGEYVIIQVPPGTYSVQASFIGYAQQTVTGVQVLVDRTITLNFELQQTALAGEEVVVSAEREIIRADVSFSQNNLTSEAIEAVPANFRLNDFLETQVGVEQGRYGLEIRGSGRNEIGYLMDGMPLRNDRMDEGFDKISKTAIQEVQLLTGSFNAEHGKASAGIVQVVTKSTRTNFFLNFEGRYSPLWGGDDPEFPGLKHFGPYIFSNDNWWEYGRFDWNNGAPAADRDGDGEPDFEGWTAWAEGNTFHGEALTPQQAFEVWQWQHRSEGEDGNVLYNGEPLGTIDELYRSDPTHTEPFNHYSYRGDFVGDITVGGPVPFTDSKLGFMLSHINENSMYPMPTPTGGVYKYNTSQLKLTYDLTSNLRLQATGLYSDQTSFNSGDPEPRSGLDGTRVDGVRWMFGERDGTFSRDSDLVPKEIWTRFTNLKLTHTLGSNTFYELKASYSDIDYKQVGNLRLRNLGNVYQVGPVWLDESPKGWSYHHGDASDILDLYELRGDRNSDLSQARAFTFSADLSSQINVHHQIKTGVELYYRDLHERTGYTQNIEYFISEEFRLGPDGQAGTADDGSPGDQANWHDIRVYPVTAAAYIQDKMEYGAMILNAGLRVDVHDPHDQWFDRNDLFFPAGNLYWDQHYNRYGENARTGDYENYYGLPIKTEPPIQLYVSPRFGISHPISATSKVFFNYGHFYDLPPLDHFYRIQLGNDEPLEEIGNAWLRMPRTIQFEAGWEQSFLDNYRATFSGYYKDVTNDIDGSEIISRESGSPNYSINGLGRDIKGLELSIEKQFGVVTGFINTDYRLQANLHYGWEEIYPQESGEYREDPNLTEYLMVVDDPFINIREPGRWRVKLNLALHSPVNWGGGPVIGGTTPLGGWDISVLHRYEQGDAFNWNPEGLERLRGVFNEREKDYHRTDLHLAKRFMVAGGDIVAFMDITNLFNVKNLFSRDWGDLISEYDESEITDRQRAYMAAIEAEGKKVGAETDDPSLMPQRLYQFWEAPRDMWLGIQVNF